MNPDDLTIRHLHYDVLLADAHRRKIKESAAARPPPVGVLTDIERPQGR
jgi:hypothetical protein